MTENDRSSRFPAFVWGALAPTSIGLTIILILFVGYGMNGVPFRDLGTMGNLIFILPGTLFLSALFAVPIAGVHVLLMAWLSRRWRAADNVFSWTLMGAVIAASPAATLWYCSGEQEFADPMGLLAAAGLIGGLAAGLKRPRIVTILREAEG